MRRGCAAIDRKFCAEEITGSPDSAVSQFHLHFVGLFTRPKEPSSISDVGRHLSQGAARKEIDRLGRCDGCSKRSVRIRTEEMDWWQSDFYPPRLRPRGVYQELDTFVRRGGSQAGFGERCVKAAF